MAKNDKEDKFNEDIAEEIKEELEEIQNEDWEIEEELIEEAEWNSSDELTKLKEVLARTQADFDNFKKRSERDREDMIFFLKADILKKILPRVDDLERIIKNTPKEMQEWALFEWIESLRKSLKKDLDSMWAKSFKSIWKEPNPDRHEVMTKIPWWEDGIIIEEFEKWYNLWDRVLRVAKVVVWSWE